MQQRRKIQELIICLTVLGSGFLLATSVSVKLFVEGRNRPAIGLVIVAAILLGFIVLFFLPPDTLSTDEKFKVEFPKKRKGENLACIMETKDELRLNAAQNAMRNGGIECYLFGQHAPRLMPFLPGVTYRLMVPSGQYEKAKLVIEQMEDRIRKMSN